MIEYTGTLTKLITSTKRADENKKFLNRKRHNDQANDDLNNIDDLLSPSDWREL
jgi:hypothetical protein